eukprot:6505119-Alexandrium_andersonii.AAC.1
MARVLQAFAQGDRVPLWQVQRAPGCLRLRWAGRGRALRIGCACRSGLEGLRLGMRFKSG